jgi:hypothetical protein
MQTIGENQAQGSQPRCGSGEKIVCVILPR